MSKTIRINPTQDAEIRYQGSYNSTAWNTVHDAGTGTHIFMNLVVQLDI